VLGFVALCICLALLTTGLILIFYSADEAAKSLDEPLRDAPLYQETSRQVRVVQNL
jgi:hypothetical protein